MNSFLPFKAAIAQLNVHVGNFEENTSKIIARIEEGKSAGVQLLIFPELVLCGYPPRDFLEFDFFLNSVEQSISKIASYCSGIHVVLGAPSRNREGAGKRLYNSAFYMAEGAVQKVIHKTLLPTYDIFDEYRYFEPNRDFEVLEILGHKFGIAICEDVWNVEGSRLYQANPVEVLAGLGARTIINIAASPFSATQHQRRVEVLKENAQCFGVNLLYCNHIGAQTELIFDGGSMFMNHQGEVMQRAPFFKECLLINEGDVPASDTFEKVALQHDALVLGIREYFRKQGFTRAILGLSGGIDSAVTYGLACEALGAKNVLGVLLPSQYSSDHSVEDAKQIVRNYGGRYEVIKIHAAFETMNEELREVFQGASEDLTEENLQARIRGVYLMAISNKQGYILLNTSNKSEAAVGYGTLYGDMNGGLSVLGDLYKTEVFELARFMNRDREMIPENTLLKPPSAELRHGQKDSDSLPDYGQLDPVLRNYIEGRKGWQEIVAMGYDESMVKRILNLVNRNEYKRYQTPPILRLSEKAFGMGRRMPIVADYKI